MKVYIAGKITGNQNYERQFKEAEKKAEGTRSCSYKSR